jgi:amino acid transporter
LVFDLDQGAELVNFGACLGFMAVNLSVLGHYFVRRRQRGGAGIWTNFTCPVLGFAICFYIWLSISPLAMRVGALWTAAGLVYLAVQTGAFKRKPS